MNLKTIVVGPFATNCYLYWDEPSGDGIIIDPGAEPDRLLDEIEASRMKLLAILLTHGHGDHIAAVKSVKEACGVPLWVGAGEEDLLANPSANASALYGQPIVAPPPDYTVIDEDLISLGPISLRVLATPGHSPGGVCYLDESQGTLFCGDTLFYGSIGRTDFPGCSHQVLIQSINDKILKLPDPVVCYPGHGPATTVGAERNHNPFLKGDYFV
ncbi:MAG: MBL fold metallo-hydrolase [Candidatus Zixiibacteriota bacterium]|nr:MAG: MBL fold metallo-hydrolase [candidate division Zixibacteria bacterium]